MKEKLIIKFVQTRFVFQYIKKNRLFSFFFLQNKFVLSKFVHKSFAFLNLNF